jgi:peptidoglycan hydrolase-like protein with peptidoglycan-binding domain
MPRTLSKGMTGQDVREIQDALNFHIRRLTRLQVDGIFGPKTDGRVREFQKVNSLAADGLVGPKTRALLFGFKHRQISLGILPTASLSINTSPGTPSTPSAPLRFPNPFKFPRLQLTPFVLPPSRFILLPQIQPTPTLLELMLRVPVRRDPRDPHVVGAKGILTFVNDLDINKKLGPFVVDKLRDIEIDGVTNPFLAPFEGGFDWGGKPVNLFSTDSIGLAANAEYTLKITRDDKAGSPNVVVGVWGDLQGILKFEGKQGQSSPTLHVDGNLFLGAKGTF